MSTPAEPTHLSNHHRATLRQIFQHPVSHNIEWRSVLSLLETVGSVTENRDDKLSVAVGDQAVFLDPPAGKDIDAQMVVDLRHLLGGAGYGAGHGAGDPEA
jgi:hypothetical protein